MRARIGRPAPEFSAQAFYNKGFRDIKLADYVGKWRLLIFYPGDFTFV